MSLKTTLIDRAWVIIAEFLVLSELGKGEELVLVGKYFLVSCTQVTRIVSDWPEYALDIKVLSPLTT